MKQTVGQRLKTIRESRGISLEEISKKTNIREKYLRAIESNDVDALPSPMQMRGFLRLYASVLDLEIDSLKVKGYHLSQKKQPSDTIPSGPKDKPDVKKDDAGTPETEIQEIQLEETEQEAPSISTTHKEAGLPTELETADDDEIAAEITMGDVESGDIFAQIGERLHERRNLLSLSLDDVRSQLHIRKHYLQALEEGKMDELPSPVQAKGMLSNYAEFLNLDNDDVLLDFAEGLQKQHLEKASSAKKTNRPAKELSKTALKLRNFFSLDLLIIAAIFIGFSAFVIWGANRIMSSDSPESSETSLPEVADVLLATSSPTPQLTSSLDITPQTEDGVTTSDAAGQTPLFTPNTATGAINIIVIPLQQAWVRVSSDSEIVYEGRLMPGNAYDYSGEEKVEILTGNAGALQIYFNDQNLGSVGLMGQVANLIFTQDGLILPTPTNTPTPTETPNVTPTPTLTPSPSPTLTETNDQES